ncbi:MAG: hypothetical protein R3A10_13280 [Caldilineaceae bacterium]
MDHNNSTNGNGLHANGHHRNGSGGSAPKARPRHRAGRRNL